MGLTGNKHDWQETYVSALQGAAEHPETDEHDIPSWIPDGQVKQTLIGHGNLLGMLPNKHGELTLCTVELAEDGSITFSQMRADGEQTIAVRVCNAAQIRQIEAKLK